MIDTQVYLEKLSLFGRILRQEGLEVTPAETADACRILLELGFESREVVKTALRTVYAKNRDEQLRFDRIFDSFFLSEAVIRAIDKKHTQEELRQAEAAEQARRELQGENRHLDYTEEQQIAFAHLSEEEKERLRNMKERFMGEGARNPELYANLIHSVFARSILEQQMMMEDAASGAAALDPEVGLLFRDISQFQDYEIPKAVFYIQDIARRINGELTQKRRHTGRSSKLDFRRTIRKGLETGGRFHRLAWKRKRMRRKQLVVLCDVSGSMIQFSEFVLRFIQSLNQASGSSRVFLFSEDLFEADPFHLQNMDLFRDYVRQSGMYGRGTALGSALQKLNERKPPVFSPATTFLIISDAKTMDQEVTARELLRARAHSGRVFWLNPIPERRWKYLNGARTMSELCTMISCSTLEELGAACRKLAML